MVIQIFFDQHVGKGIHQRHVAAVFDLQMLIGNTCGFDAAGVADDDLRAFFFRFDHTARDDGMGIRAVIAEHQQTF
ncbi:hypothetical protein SRABI106_01829 [Rahnella aquatilis]|nr:hypothetical protein SRABI106_01829 [Rahnella aquatilis]